MDYYWLKEPAKDWEMSLPLGNGRLGASIWGKIDQDRITMNEETFWYGAESSRRNHQSGQYISKIQNLILQGQPEDAQFLTQMAMTGTPKYIKPYQVACDMNFIYRYPISSNSSQKTNRYVNKEIKNYKRKLNLEEAVSSVEFELDGVAYKREYFVSMDSQVVVIKLTASKKCLQFQFNINRRPYEQYSGGDGKSSIYLKGQLGDGVKYYCGAILGENDGDMCQIGDYIGVWNASTVIIYFDAETNFTGGDYESTCKERLEYACKKGFSKIYQKHLDDYQKLYHRVSFQLQEKDFSVYSMEELFLRLEELDVRQYLTQLLFAFGRYLLISSSSKCLLPANLEGIWTNLFEPRWENKFTININLEMNYWAADSCGLSECFTPFENLVLKIMEKGKETARDVYHCKGSVAHHNTDCYGCADLEGLPASAYMWTMGEAWLCLNLFDHYEYTQDISVLTQSAMPVAEQTIYFFYDFMYRDQSGLWYTVPSVSPENTYQTDDGQIASVTYSPTMDIQILWELCTKYLKGVQVLLQEGDHQESKATEMAKEILSHLPPIQLTSDGRIREWIQDFQEVEKGHRHISHLFGLYPGNQIDENNKKLFNAAKKTIETRLKNGSGHTGWSRVWLLCMYARLKDRAKVDENIKLFLEKSLNQNLFDVIPPFQIDANLGFCAGIIETIVQVRESEIWLLPAIPIDYKQGYIKGITLKGGYQLTLYWNNESIEYTITSVRSAEIILHYGLQTQKLTLRAGESYQSIIRNCI